MAPAPLDFRELTDLRLFLRSLLDRQVESLRYYHDKKSGGFYHRHDKPTPGKLSKSSTATCVLSLIATNQWNSDPWQGRTSALVRRLLNDQWKSAGLPKNNVFTVGFVFEAVTDLLRHGHVSKLNTRSKQRLAEAQNILVTEAGKGAKAGALSVQGYPPSAYVTQLVVRALLKQGKLRKRVATDIAGWAEHEINRQITLLTGNDKTADVFQLAYSTILLASLVRQDLLKLKQEFVIDTALDEIFRRQREDGTWPLSRPLFHYPDVGSAHCYDYEMLVQLLSERTLADKLLRFIPNLAQSARVLNAHFRLGLRGAGWSSGHHPQLEGPESWSTASVYHFAHAFERLIAEQIRRETFGFLERRYSPPVETGKYKVSLPSNFLDCRVKLDGRRKSLKRVIASHILKPLIAEEKKGTVSLGQRLPKETPISIILFGPPGTSKTRLAHHISEMLSWPLLEMDASHFLKHGMDGVYAEADRIFGRLAVAERIFVLLDEFDEMVRARETATDVLSRFLTTAMLPKLHQINDNRRLAFVVATNHIEAFDVAIRRPGRFDVILQVMPPTAKEKLRRWPELSKSMAGVVSAPELRKKLEPLTFAETESLLKRVAAARSKAAKRAALDAQHSSCTLLSDTLVTSIDAESDEAPKKKKWNDVCKDQSGLSRVP